MKRFVLNFVGMFALPAVLVGQQKAPTKPAAPPVQHAAPLDRSKIPGSGAAPVFKMPAFTVDTLSNGARLVVVTRSKLPIVTLSVHFQGGSDAVGGNPTATQFLNSMTREGTTNRTSEQLATDLAMLGNPVSVSVGSESGAAGFSSVVHNFDKSMDLMMDMMLNSTYPQASLDRLRTSALVSYRSSQDAAATVGSQVSSMLLYGDQPYGRVTTEADLNSVTREDVASLARKIFVPANAIFYVVGAMTRVEAKAHIERGIKAWPKNGEKLAMTYPKPYQIDATKIYVVDMGPKPQSYLRLGRPMIPSYSPDMARLTVTNYILGGALQSRLSANIREAHGYSYGFNSGISWSKGPGPFSAAGAVTREVTDSAVFQAMKEIRELGTTHPASAAELVAAKNGLTLSLPSRLQSNATVLATVARVMDENLPRDWWAQYIAQINNTTGADVTRTAVEYFDPGHLVIVVAGDASKILEPLRKSGIAPVVVLDKSGKPKQ